MAYRQIDMVGFWKGDPRAIDRFAKAFSFDCGGCELTFQRVYGWKMDSIERAIGIAFPGSGSSLADNLES